jgi:pimeloyl-ACP methyl ester carboxylesterase
VSPIPFEVRWTRDATDRVLRTVGSYVFPPAPEGSGWSLGCDAQFLQTFCEAWRSSFDLQETLASLNRFPQFTAEVDGLPIHFVHVVGEAAGRRPLLLSHGWPGSHFEFWDVVEKLAYPSRFGGSAADAFDLVIPSLPGFGFSAKPARPLGQRRTAQLFNTLMTEGLGYQTYRAQGGDWGALVTGWLGLDHPESVSAIHLNMLGLRAPGPPQGAAEQAWAARSQEQAQALGAYFQLQATKPQSLAWAMANNPVGQAAWILERHHDWADLRTKPFEAVFSLKQLLTQVMLYVMTDAFTTSVWYYRALFEEGGAILAPGQRVEVPTAFANYPGDSLYTAPPRSLVERAYAVRRWTDQPRGGHFAAMEEPDLFAEDLQAFGRDTD